MNKQQNQSFFAKAHNPVHQAGLIFGVSFVIMLVGKMLASSDAVYVGERFPWMTAASFMLFFAVFNSVVSLSAKDVNRYWSLSMMSFVGLALANGLAAWLFSSLSINEAGSYRWIYIVVTFGYLVFVSMVGMLKKIVEFAQREEWNQPRLRNRKRRK